MKNLSLLFMSLILSLAAVSQSKIPAVDKSSLDISYYPANFPILKIQDKVTEPLVMRIIYSRPQKNGRDVFGNLVEYGQVWRIGANEATEIEFFRDIMLGKTKIKKGRYTLYAITNPDKWTIILNRDTDTWGSFKYDPKKDVVRYDVKPETASENVETFSMYFEKSTGGASLIIQWDTVRTKVPFSF